jgi:hypothetical protein
MSLCSISRRAARPRASVAKSSPTRKPALIGADALSEDAECFAGNDVVGTAGHDGGGRRHVGFADSGDLFGDHAVDFGVTAGAARGDASEAKGDHVLRFESEFEGPQRQRQPRIEHCLPPAQYDRAR